MKSQNKIAINSFEKNGFQIIFKGENFSFCHHNLLDDNIKNKELNNQVDKKLGY